MRHRSGQVWLFAVALALAGVTAFTGGCEWDINGVLEEEEGVFDTEGPIEDEGGAFEGGGLLEDEGAL